MADFSHLINIIWSSIGAKKAEQETRATGAEIEKALGVVQKQAPRSATIMEQYHKALMRVAIVVPVWMAARFVLQSFFALISSQIKFLRDMEDAMARIKIVGKGTAEEYENLKYSLLGLSLAYGVSASEAMKAAVIFAQQGYTVSETLALTRAAMIGAQVLGEDIKDTVEALTAAMKAFSIPMTDATAVIDKLIAVEKQFAVTSKDLAAGIKVVGATAAMMGVSLAALSGDITAVVEVTRKSGAEAARGLQFIYARLLTTAKPVIEQLTGINFYLDEQGKATSALTGKLRIATDILDELAGKWANLSREEKLSIAVSLGSKKQLVVVNALMLNYAHSIDARIVALTSAGEAEKALAIIQDTVTYKTKQLTSAWNALTVTIADTSAWKGLIDSITVALAFYTKLINFEKGYRIELVQQSGAILANIETRQNQINSLKELITVRNKLLAKPPSDKTTERLEKINKAIEETIKTQPTIKIALKTGKPEELKKAMQDISDKLLAKKIAVQVGVEFVPQLATLEKEKRKLLGGKAYSKLALTRIEPKRLEKIAEVEKKIADLTKKQTEEQEKQLIVAKAQRVEQEIMADAEEDELRLSGELTETEKEELEIERQLINFRLLGVTTAEQQIQKEMQLVSASKFTYDTHEKTLKLEQLQNQLVEARLRLKDEERNKMASLAMQYQKADMFEKSRIRRASELMKLSPEQLAAAFEQDVYDKNIIMDYWSSFNEAGQRAVENIAMKLAGMTAPGIPILDIGLKPSDRLEQLVREGISLKGMGAEAGAVAPIINLATTLGDLIINIPEGSLERMAEHAGDTVERRLLTDPELQKAFANAIRRHL